MHRQLRGKMVLFSSLAIFTFSDRLDLKSVVVIDSKPGRIHVVGRPQINVEQVGLGEI